MYEVTPDGFVDKRFTATQDGIRIAPMRNSGDPERDLTVLQELVEAANREVNG